MNISDISVVLLAAGQARRYGSNKLAVIHPQSDLPLICHVIKQYQKAGFTEITVLTGCWHDQLDKLLPDSIPRHYVEDWQQGMSAGLRSYSSTAIQHAKPLLVGLGDQAGLSADFLEDLTKQFITNGLISASEYEGIIGAPVIFPVNELSVLDTLHGDQGAGKWLRQLKQAHPGRIKTVSTAPILDIDIQSDWQKLD